MSTADLKEEINKYLIDNHSDICLYILTPCYGGLCYTPYVGSLMETTDALKSYDIEVHVEFCNCDSLVPRARNNLIARAMNNPKTTHMLFIDADIQWNAIDVLKLLFHNKPIIGGVYPLKSYKWNKLLENNQSNVNTWVNNKNNSILKDAVSDADYISNKLLNYNLNYVSNNVHIQNNTAEVRHIATGFMMIQRNVIEKMIAAFPYTKYVDDIGFLKGTENDHAYALFDCGVENNHYYSEDWLFCERWRKMEGQIFIDVSINLNHIGTETYKGCYLSSLI